MWEIKQEEIQKSIWAKWISTQQKGDVKQNTWTFKFNSGRYWQVLFSVYGTLGDDHHSNWLHFCIHLERMWEIGSLQLQPPKPIPWDNGAPRVLRSLRLTQMHVFVCRHARMYTHAIKPIVSRCIWMYLDVFRRFWPQRRLYFSMGIWRNLWIVLNRKRERERQICRYALNMKSQLNHP